MVGSPNTRRQATACDWCRSHKVKCDTQQPSCRNCVRRGVTCHTVNLRKPGAEGERLLPKGRRSRGSPSVSTTSRSGTSANAASTEEHPGDTISGTTQYPPTPQQPAQRNFETRSPDKILPAIFATPFDSETVAEGMLSDASASDSLADIRPSAGQVGDRTRVTLVKDKSRFRQQAVDSSSSQYVLVQWLDLFFARCPTWTPILPFIQQGLAYSLDMPLPFPTTLPPLPADDTARTLTALFFSRIYPIFPVINLDSFQQSLADLGHKTGRHPGTLEAQDYPLLASAYAVFSAAADEEAGNISADGTRYLEAAYSLYAQLVATPYLASVQALLLLTLVLRNRNKDGASWSSLSQAICIAHSVGLHRRVLYNTRAPTSPGVRNADIPSTPADNDLRARVWWIAYTLERTIALEAGLPSLIRDEECDQIIPSCTTSLSAGGCSFDYFQALISLAQIKSRAIYLLYGSKNQRKSVRALLFEMGAIDRALVDWADSFPDSIRPGRDLFCGANELHLATYMSLHYHQTMIALHRPALMSAPGFLRNRINKYCTGTPWHDRLHFSLCIGAASARSILKVIGDLRMYVGPSRIITANQMFVAILVIGIYVTKIPMSHMNNSDLALLTTFAEQIEEEYVEMGQDSEFAKGLKMMRQQLHDYNNSLRPNQAVMGNVREASTQPQGLTYDSTVGDFDYNAVANLEESWSYFWNEDFCTLLSNGVEQDITSMYLLGLPQSWS